MAAVTKLDLAAQALVDWQQGTNGPKHILPIFIASYLEPTDLFIKIKAKSFSWLLKIRTMDPIYFKLLVTKTLLQWTNFFGAMQIRRTKLNRMYSRA